MGKDDFCILRNLKVEIMDVPTLASSLGVCNMTVYRYLRLKNPLPAHKARGKYFFFADEVLRWLKNR